MSNLLLVIALLFAIWGWVLVLALAAWLVGTTFWQRALGRPWRWQRLLVGVVLVVVGFGWQQATLSMTFGRTLGVVASADGQKQASIELHGARTYVLKLDAEPQPWSFWLISGHPSEVFWMRGDKAIGVVSRKGDRAIYEVELIMNYDPSEPVLDEQEARRKLSSHGYSPAPEEVEEFESARRLAAQRGLLWSEK